MSRVLLWVQHLLGTGHTVRAAALGQALARRGAAVTLAAGAPPPPTLDLAGLRVVPLPPVLATDASFKTLQAPDGTPYAALAPCRRDRLAALAETLRPHIILTETFPFGRRPFAAELIPLLETWRPRGTLVAASLRDVLVRKPPERTAAMAALARAHYSRVLVHADPAFVCLDDTFEAAPALADLIAYTGFVHAPPPTAAPDGDGAGEILVSSGGSGVGARLVATALAAAALRPDGPPWRILVAPPLLPRLDGWRAAAPPHVRLEPNRPDFRALLARSALSISQAGYNTALDVLAAGTRAILVPFAAGEETEQTDRAAALARRGLATHTPEAALTPARLAEAVAVALAAPPPARPPLDLSGADRTADLLLAAVRERAEGGPPAKHRGLQPLRSP